MDFKEASHRLRITPTLLKWFTSYSPKGDGRKLQQKAPGDFDAVELDAFDASLRTAWSSRNVPAGIEVELLVEACGHCGLCGDPCEKLEMAHVYRKDVEAKYYFQHPANLITLCGSCHNRYDDLKLKTVTFEVIQAAKERLIARKMEAIDRDVERAKAVRELVEATKAELASKLSLLTGVMPSNQTLWVAGAADLLMAATQGIFGAPRLVHGLNLTSTPESLATLSGSITSAGDVTHALLDGYVQEASGLAAVAPSEWDMIECEDDRTACDLCDPGEDRSPPMVNYDPHEDGHGAPRVDVGHCDWCNGISARCRECGVVRGVLEGDHGAVLECEGGCGLRFTVNSDYDPRDGGGGAYVEVLDNCEDEEDEEDGEDEDVLVRSDDGESSGSRE